MGWLKAYLPVMAMLLSQFIYAGVSLSSRVVFSGGMSPRVFVVYRHALATIVIAPIAYFSGYYLVFSLFISISSFYLLILHFLSFSQQK